MMEYPVVKLSALAGVSARTLRYYDEIGLLKPKRINESGYRIYGAQEVDRLQQILFYRELGLGLQDIKNALDAPEFDAQAALQTHLHALLERRGQLDLLIANVQKTLCHYKGEIVMTDQEKFEGLKKERVKENEARYGEEIRKKYGEAAVIASNEKALGMTQAQYEAAQSLEAEIKALLRKAHATGDPGSAMAQRACEKHREWLIAYWPEYSKAAHKGLAQMYVDDERFRAYYEAIAQGCTEFFRDAINVYCKE